MLAVVQIINSGSVSIEGDTNTKRNIDNGFLILLGVSKNDSELTLEKVFQKLLKLRIFPDSDQKMNLDISQANGEVLLISQFTLLGNPKGNNRPDFTEAAGKDLALNLYNLFADKLTSAGIPVTRGYFGEHMLINANLTGPVTIILDSEKL